MKWLVLSFSVLLVLVAYQPSPAQENPYPNELKHLKLYARYLKPLRPGISNEEDVVKTFGSDARVTKDDWSILPLYECSGEFPACSHATPGNTRLSELRLTASHRISLRHLKVPGTFSYSGGGVSEINVTCDIYSDNSGLQYWVLSSDSETGRKGDLLWIVYKSPPEQSRPQ
jgi:hypothetical protein